MHPYAPAPPLAPVDLAAPDVARAFVGFLASLWAPPSSVTYCETWRGGRPVITSALVEIEGSAVRYEVDPSEALPPQQRVALTLNGRRIHWGWLPRADPAWLMAASLMRSYFG